MPDAGYENFDLLIARHPAGYQAHVIRAPVGSAETTFALPAAGAPDIGAALYAAAFGGEVDVCFQRSLDVARERGCGLRVRLRFARDAPELAVLPWERLHVPALARALALSEHTSLARYLPVGQPVEPLDVSPPLHVLAVVAGPRGTAPLRVEREWAGMQRSLRPELEGEQIDLQRLEPPTLDALRAYLQSHAVHVLHFIGHGRYDPATDQGSLAFEDESGALDLVPAETLGVLLHDHDPLRFAFLNACQGAQGAAGDPYAGVAQHLVRQGIPAVLAMRDLVSDNAAIALSQTFYRALADGSDVDTALSHARKAVERYPGAEWATPVLMSRSEHNRLFRVVRLRPFEPRTVTVPGGTFTMGSPEASGVPAYETPPHPVYLSTYRIGVYPVTNDQYAAFVRETNHTVRRHMGWNGKIPPPGRGNHPVMGITYKDARAYCTWLSEYSGRTYALPNEAQWEKAARGTDGRAYPWGTSWDPARCHHGAEDTAPVDRYPPQNDYGCCDMVGNVREWTRSPWGTNMLRPDEPYIYPWTDERSNIANPYLYRVCRGGSRGDDPLALRCSARQGWAPDDTTFPGAGFRVVLQGRTD